MSSDAWEIGAYYGFSLSSPLERAAWHEELTRNGGNTLEIGTYCGVSACELAAKCPDRTVFSVDTLNMKTCHHVAADSYALNRLPNMRLWVGTLAQMVAEVGWPAEVRTVWVDGGHYYDDVKSDLLTVVANMPIGSILVHDFTAPCFQETIKRACDEVLTGWTLAVIHDTVAVFRNKH